MDQSDALMSDPDIPTIPTLPQSLWDAIVGTIFASQSTWPLPTALRQLGSLSKTSRALRTACAASTWTIDATGALDAHIDVLAGPAPQPALTSLALGAFENREWVLRAASAHTLQRYQYLETLTLYASEFFSTLYPAVLAGLPALKSLELVDYVMREPLTAAVPPEVLSNLKSLVVRHLPSVAHPWALDSHINPQFRASLDTFIIDGAFDRIQAADYAPSPSFDLPAVLASATHVKIEGCLFFVWDTKLTEPVSAKWMAEIIAAPGGRWKTLEVRGLAGGVLCWHDHRHPFFLKNVGEKLREMDPQQREGLEWEHEVRTEGIFDVFCLRAWRRGKRLHNA